MSIFTVLIIDDDDQESLHARVQDCLHQQRIQLETIVVTTKELQIDLPESVVVIKTNAEFPSERKNIAIKYSTSKYFTLLEEGTRIHPNYCITMLTGFRETSGHFGYCPTLLNGELKNVPDFLDSRLTLGNFYPPVFSFSRDLWGNLGGFKNTLGPYDNWDFWARVYLLEKTLKQQIAFKADEPLAYCDEWSFDILADYEYRSKAINNYSSLFFEQIGSLTHAEVERFGPIMECLK
ncbi:MAG: hypothetical protein WDA42_06875 [Candidatus Bathyarchaeia archaeon]